MNLTQDLLPGKEPSHHTTGQGLSQQDEKQVIEKPSTPALNINDAFFCIRKYKYFNAIVLILSALCNSMIGVSFATINHEVTQYYGVSTQLVSFCALQFLFINPLISLFANYILDNKGLKLGVSINCVLNIIGVTLRLFINQWFGFVIIGNAFSAMGNIFIINCPARFSSVWFKPSQRIVITSLIAFANAVSGEIGAIMSPYFVGNDLTPEEGRNSISQLIYFQAILVSSVMFVNLMFFKGVPGKKTNPLQQSIEDIEVSPPISNDFIFSHSSQISSQSSSQQSLPRPLYVPISSQSIESVHQQQKKQRHQRYINQLKTLFTTKNYLLSLVSFSLIASVLNSFATNVQLYILPFGFNSIDAGNLTFVSVGTGLFGAVFSSLIIKKLKKFKIVIQLEILFSVVFSVSFILSLITQQIWLLYLSVGMFTMLLYPLFPAIGEYCCQFMHPIRESTVMGLLVGVAQLFSFAVGMVQTVLLEQKSQKNVIICLIINAGCYLIALIAMSLTKQSLKRLCQKQEK